MSLNSNLSLALVQPALALAPIRVKFAPIVTLFGNPIVTVLSVTVVSISFAVPENVKVSVPSVTLSVPVSPAMA